MWNVPRDFPEKLPTAAKFLMTLSLLCLESSYARLQNDLPTVVMPVSAALSQQAAEAKDLTVKTYKNLCIPDIKHF